MYNINYDIKPIFNADEKTYDDFIRLELLCDKDQCHGDMYKQEIKKYYIRTEKEKYRFMFAAFQGKEKIGFTHGFFSAEEMGYMFLEALYVNPEYHGCGVGTNLLKITEDAVGIVNSNIRLNPLFTAVSFYQQYKYNHLNGGYFMTKKLPKTSTGIIPVFEWCDELQSKLNFKADNTLLIDCKNQPKYIYVGKDSRIDGVAILLPDGEKFIQLNEKQKSLLKCRKAELSCALDNCR